MQNFRKVFSSDANIFRAISKFNYIYVIFITSFHHILQHKILKAFCLFIYQHDAEQIFFQKQKAFLHFPHSLILQTFHYFLFVTKI